MRFKAAANAKPIQLPVPQKCDLPYFDQKWQHPTLACHKSLACQRCHLRLIHCECAKEADKPAAEGLKGEQQPLCDAPTFSGRYR